MTDLVAVDVGGTHVRFGRATVDGPDVRLGEVTTLCTGDYAGLAGAWAAYAAGETVPLPPAAAIAVACPVEGDVLRLTNNAWAIERAAIGQTLGVARWLVINDFEAVAHAVAALPATALAQVAGPDLPLLADGVVSVIGPGTGLGVAQLVRRGARVEVVATEGGHIGFAPSTTFDDALLARLRARHGRVSAERVVSGPGLRAIVEELTGEVCTDDDATLWRRALDGEDATTREALDHFCRLLGAVAADIALAHGANAVVVAGGLGLRLAEVLPHSSFGAGFADKGRFADRMRALPVRTVTHPQPGLFGAAAAFAREFAT